MMNWSYTGFGQLTRRFLRGTPKRLCTAVVDEVGGLRTYY